MPGFIALTMVVNAAGVLVLPALCGSLWYITARKACIGSACRNGIAENSMMAGLFMLSLWGAYHSAKAFAGIAGG